MADISSGDNGFGAVFCQVYRGSRKEDINVQRLVVRRWLASRRASAQSSEARIMTFFVIGAYANTCVSESNRG
jgi:hypothetical protein